MKFFGREQELKSLNAIKGGMVVIYGRRRVGKTELIKQFISGRESIYFFVNPKKSNLLQEFVAAFREKAGLPDYIRPEHWKDFIRLLLDEASKRKMVVAFDEFQRFMEMDESIIHDFQDAWDMCGRKPLIIFSGSSIGMMKKVFVESKAPLFKRASAIIELKPFGFRDVSHILDGIGVKDAEERMKMYFAFGGIIYYYVLMEEYGCTGFQDATGKLVLNPHSPIQNEVRDILIEEFGKNYGTYQAIIEAISIGKSKRNEIADHAGIKETSLSPYLYDLMDTLSLVRRSVRATDEWKSKDVRYELSDNFIIFWTRFVLRNESLLEIGDLEGANRKIAESIDSFFGRRFEEFCREFVMDLKVKEGFQRIGRWWGHYRDESGKRKETDIDAVALNRERKEAYFFECKWSGLSEAEARSIILGLEEKAKSVEWLCGKRKEFYGVFARKIAGKEALRNEGFLAFDLEDFK